MDEAPITRLCRRFLRDFRKLGSAGCRGLPPAQDGLQRAKQEESQITSKIDTDLTSCGPRSDAIAAFAVAATDVHFMRRDANPRSEP